MEKNWFFIINPKAGNGDFEKVWREIEGLALAQGIAYEAHFTTAQNDGCNKVKECIARGYRNFIVMGGDGTINEVVNGFFGQSEVLPEQLSMGLISQGTGNDWGRYYQHTSNPAQAFENIISRKSKQQDVGVITHSINGERKTSYFANIAGFGFDAQVVKSTNKMMARGRRKKSAYLINLLKCLINNKYLNASIQTDSNSITGEIFSISIGNGRYSGGGMMQTPYAIIDDGLLDITIYHRIPKLRVIKKQTL